MKWVTAWGNAISIAERRAETYAKDVTLRYPVKCAFGGSRVRLHFSNFCGTESVRLDCVTVARSAGEREIFPKDAKIALFGGKEYVEIAAGEEIFSDEIYLDVAAGSTLAVSFYLGGFTLMRSAVTVTGPLSKGYFSVGNQCLSPVLPLNYTRSTDIFYFLSGVDLFTDDNNRCVVCYGDSITAQSYPDFLALDFMDGAGCSTAVVRRAASGTRVLREYKCITYESYGLCGRNRFARELSSVSGAESVIIQQGINDIIHPVGVDVNPFRPMSDLPTVEQLFDGIKEYVAIARGLGLKVYVGTLLPIKGWRTYAPFREEMKERFNSLVRALGDGVGVIDFDKAVRDERDKSAFAPENDSGDHLHPSERAYKIMADEAYRAVLNGRGK